MLHVLSINYIIISILYASDEINISLEKLYEISYYKINMFNLISFQLVFGFYANSHLQYIIITTNNLSVCILSWNSMLHNDHDIV